MDHKGWGMTQVNLHGIVFNCAPGMQGAFGTFQDGQRGTYRDHDEMLSFIKRTSELRHLVDCGAADGAYSLAFTRFPDATSIAIEPSPRLYPMLVEHCRLNPTRKITPVNAFVGMDRGVEMNCSYLGQQLHADQGGGPEWHIKYGGTPMEDAHAKFVQVPLDDICDVKPVDCIKIDTEGFECSVLRSAVKTIERCRPLIFLEIHATCFQGHGESAESFSELIDELGYDLWHHDGEPSDPVLNNSFMRVYATPR
jgi:FkbM family methyltransferase